MFIYETFVVLRKVRNLVMEKLSVQEEEVMQAVWHTGGGFIRDFMEHIPNVPPYTTVASTVKNLEKKKFVQSKKMANSFFYTPIVKEEEYKRKHLSEVVKDYFQNSYKELVTFFAKDKKISPEELKEIIRLIEKNK